MRRGQDWLGKQLKFTDMVKNGDFAYEACVVKISVRYEATEQKT